ncbi:hypothetical protein [Macrococcus bovicus]|uniref:hypothetical protein n=1 Tax=Macrococcus bovicus TaxID=69968 RepID=UPI0025A522BA|nr:hypothetical protein [Macrococcus bovicus]WJP97268.1 hypothetical protein QSV55_08250 [Macrococcus bovicus]
MKLINSLYPYPVLSSFDNDYIDDSDFCTEVKLIESTPYKPAKVKIKFVLKDKFLEELVAAKQAAFFIHVESPRAVYRELIKVTSSEDTQIIIIDPKKMRHNVEITPLLLTTNSLKNFINPNINKELFGSNYVFPILSSGYPLAVDKTKIIEIVDKDDFSSVSSIIKVGKTKEKLMNIELEDDYLFVRLPEKQYKKYVTFKDMPEALLSSIIFPSLVYVFESISKHGREPYENYKWFNVLEKKFSNMGFSIDQIISQEISSIVLAQKVLVDPLQRMFNEIEDVTSLYAND